MKQQNDRILYLENVINNLSQFVFWKDIHCTFLGCNKRFAASAGLESPNAIIGKTDFDMPWAPEESHTYRKDDEEIISTKLPKINYLEFQKQLDDSERLMLVSKMPVYDERNDIIGVMGIYSDVTEHHLTLKNFIPAKNTAPQTTFFIDNPFIQTASEVAATIQSRPFTSIDCTLENAYVLNRNGKIVKLTKREAECVFLLYQGMNNKLIARELKISHRTVEEYFASIKTKLYCRTRLEIFKVLLKNPQIQQWFEEKNSATSRTS